MITRGKQRDIRQLPVVEEDNFGDLASVGGRLIDQAVFGVCANHYAYLKNQPVIYISNAVWGIGAINNLDDVQISINRLVEPVILNWLDAVEANCLDSEQRFAVEYALRGWVLARILYSLELMPKSKLENCDLESTEKALFYQ